MTLKVSKPLQTLEDARAGLDDIKDNFSFEDIRLVNPLTTVPTTDTLEKGKATLREISGVPRIYVRGTNGTIYLMSTGTPI